MTDLRIVLHPSFESQIKAIIGRYAGERDTPMVRSMLNAEMHESVHRWVRNGEHIFMAVDAIDVAGGAR